MTGWDAKSEHPGDHRCRIAVSLCPRERAEVRGNKPYFGHNVGI
jgi:hypothetical protein